LNVPLSRVRRVVTNLNPLPVAPETDDTGVTPGQQLGAAFRSENVIVAGAEEIFGTRRAFKAEPGFNPVEHLLPGEETNWAHLADARSLAEMNEIRRERDTETLLRQQLGNGPLPEILATGLAVLADPTSYIPFFGWGSKAATGARMAVSLAARTAGEVAVSELALQATQQTRTAQESAIAVMFGGAFGLGIGGALAGAAARSSARTADVYAKAVKDYTDMALGPASLSAASTRAAPEDTKLISTGLAAETLAKLGKVGLAAPAVELAVSELPTVRSAIADLVDIGTVWKGAERGVNMPYPVEVRIESRANALDFQLGNTLRALVREHGVERGANAMDDKTWREVVGRAMRRGDVSPEPTVAKAAGAARTIVEALKKEAIDQKLLPPDVDVKTADSYFTRVYDREKIKARLPDFEAAVAQWLREVVTEDGLEAGDFALMARDITANIMGSPAGRVPFLKIPKARGPMKERTFNIPDERIEDFLVHDVQQIMSRFIRTMVTDTELARKFGRPDPDLSGDIIAEARDIVSKPKANGKEWTEAERTALQNRAAIEAKKVQAVLNLIRGTAEIPTDPAMAAMRTTAKVVRDWNLTTMLGATVPASVMDLGQIVAQHGFGRVIGGLAVDFARGFKGIRMAAKEAQLAGEVIELGKSSRLRALMDRGTAYDAVNAAERWSDWTASKFADVTGINLWNTVMKAATSYYKGTSILRTVEKLANGKTLTRREQLQLSQSYLDENMASRIWAQSSKWERGAQVIIANTELWDDAVAVRAFRDALVGGIRRTIITPGAGDAPLWTSKEWGKTLFQFKRFSSAAISRILLLNLQMRDGTALAGLTSMVALGALSQVFRDIAADGEVKDRTAREWAVNAVDRSGVLGLLMEGDSLLGKAGVYSAATGGRVQSLAQAAAGTEPERYQGRSLLASVLGPSASQIESIKDVLNAFGEDTMTTADMHRLRRLMPGQNLFYLQYLLNRAEEGLSDNLGLPDQRARPTSGRLPKRD